MIDIKQAREALLRFCQGKQRMCVPAQPDDDDMILSSALDKLERLWKALESIANYQRDQYESTLYAYDNCKVIAREALKSIKGANE